MKTTWNRTVTNASLLLAAAVLTTSAWGQVQRVQVGRALDANPLVGSGGSNQPISGYIPGQANGNDIISGNVAGLKYFHGRIDELTPYTFGAHLGSADLDAFARQSAGGIPTSPGAQPYFQPSTIVSTGQGTLYSSPVGNGFDSRFIPQSSVSSLSGQVNGAWIGGVIPVRSYGESGPATFNGVSAPGRAIQSPLFSLRAGSEPLTGAPTLPDQNVQNTDVSPLTPLPQIRSEVKPDQSQDNTGNNTDQTSNNTNNNTGQLNNRPVNDQARIAIGDSQRVNGQPLDMRNQPIGPQELASNQQGQVSDLYKQLSDNLDKAAGIEKPATDQTALNGTNTQTPGLPGNNVAALGQQNNQNGQNGTGGNGKNDTSSPRNMNTARTNGAGDWRTAATPNSGMPNSGMTGADNTQDTGIGGIRYQSTDPSLPGYRPRGIVMDEAAQLMKQPDKVLKAGKKVDPLKSLAAMGGGTPQLTPFGTLMKQGEDLMKAGKYLDAADTYQTALARQPNDPLALLGRGNAELAAGMFESAAYDLKMVFANKPTMIGVRYTLGDYIPISRQDTLIKDLSEMTTVQERGNLGSFLLCYLYYNTGRRNELDVELGRWGNRPWKDGWEPVVEKAWGK